MAGVVVSTVVGLTGCGNFFVPPTTTSSSSSGGTNYVFTVSPVQGTVSAYTIGTSALTLASSSPVTLPSGLTSATAGAVAVSRNNSFLYVGGLDAIYCYSIGTSGALTLVSSSSITASANIVSMDTSTDGSWLFALDSTSQTIAEYSLNTTTGAMTLGGSVVYNIGTGQTNAPKTIRVGSALAVATLGTGGDALFTYAQATGLTYVTSITLPYTTVSDNDAAIQTTSTTTYLYVARSGAIKTTAVNEIDAYTVSAGTPTAFGTAAATGSSPYSLVLNTAGTYLYTANRGASTISQFSVASGVVAALSSATYSPGMVVTSLAPDSTGTYMLAGGIAASSALQMYTFSTGALVAAANASPTQDTAGLLVATTH
jgi:6-phosphogluconolactonase (cycloisomerase 2 family)